MAFFFTKFQEVNEAPVANGTIANIQFGQDTLNRYDQQAISWREMVLGKVNDTLVRCKGKIFDEIHLEPNGSKHQEYTLTLRDPAAVEAFRARVRSRVDDIEDFHFVEISFVALFARMKVESNRQTMTEVYAKNPIVDIGTLVNASQIQYMPLKHLTRLHYWTFCTEVMH